MTVCSPYFDAEGKALLRLIEETGAAQVEVLTQESSTNLLPAALAVWPAFVQARPADYFHTDEEGERKRARLHAKWILATRGDRGTAIVGSANCSRAALTVSGTAGNAELVAVIEGDANNLTESLLAELEVHKRSLEIPEAPEDNEDEEAKHRDPVVLAARYDMGTLLVAVSAHADFDARYIEVDGTVVPTHVQESGELLAHLESPPSRVRVLGLLHDKEWSTPEFWVDVEALLRGSAARRRLIDLVYQNQQKAHWTIEVWADLVDAAFEEIAIPTSQGGGGSPPKQLDDSAPKTWHEEDVFLSSFFLPHSSIGSAAKAEDDVVSSTLSLLIEWSRGEDGVDRLDAWNDEDDPSDLDSNGLAEDEGELDPPPPPPPPQQGITSGKSARCQKRALAVLQQMLDLLSDPEFIGERSPADIRRAIIMLALLLRVGRQQGWMRGQDFFTTSQKAWRAMFFSGHSDDVRGELTTRLELETNPDAFREALATPRLAAALAAWGLAAHQEGDGQDLVCFDLTCAVSAAHHPWVWRGASLERIGKELRQLIQHTQYEGEVAMLDTWWVQVQRRGAAIAAFEKVVGDSPTQALRSRLKAWKVEPGTITWQGSAGWCVCEQPASTDRPKDKISVRKLQGDESRRQFVSSFLVPLGPLVDAYSDQLSDAVRSELHSLISDVGRAYGV